MHGTEPLGEPVRREAAWFHQDDRKLRLIARNMGKEFPQGTTQYTMRLFIGKTIFNRDDALRQWLRDYYRIESVEYSRGVTAVTRLLERNLVPASGAFSFADLTQEQLTVLGDDMSETLRPRRLLV